MFPLKEMKDRYIPLEVPKLTDQDKQWFRDDKFGMFIHLGLYSIMGKGEWNMFMERMDIDEYSKLADNFNVEKSAPRIWAKAAKAAGMKYMVLTTKHHDGFSLFNSRYSSFNSINSACKRDIVAEFVQACRSEGLKVGLYYSPMDWRFPGYFFPQMYFKSAMALKEQCWEQIHELMTNYGKIDILWFDGAWLAHGGISFNTEKYWHTDPNWLNDELYVRNNYFWESEKLMSMIRELQPGIMINNRGGWQGDFTVRERCIGEMLTDRIWEYCDCLATSWGWMPNAPMLTLREFIRTIVTTVTKDGNLLMNIGPKGDGTVEKQQLELLSQVGCWLSEYGETIYGTRGGPFLPGKYGGATYRADNIYLHILEWTGDKVILPPLNQRIVDYKNITAGTVTVVQTEDCIEVSTQMKDRNIYDTIIGLKLEEPVRWTGHVGEENSIVLLGDGLD